MNEQPTQPIAPPTPNSAVSPDMIIAALMGRVKRSAHWFYWIAGLSLVNSVMLFFGANISFLFGLGSTQALAALAKLYPNAIVLAISIILTALLLGFYALMGFFANKAMKWAFIVGGIFYLLDAILCLAIQDWLGSAFHAWVLLNLYHGIKAIDEISKVKEQQIIALAKAPIPPPYQPAYNAPVEPSQPNAVVTQPETEVIAEKETV